MSNVLNTLHKVCGIKPEMTIRGKNKRTLSFDGIEKIASERLVKFFPGCNVEVEDDEEVGSFVYVDL